MTKYIDIEISSRLVSTAWISEKLSDCYAPSTRFLSKNSINYSMYTVLMIFLCKREKKHCILQKKIYCSTNLKMIGKWICKTKKCNGWEMESERKTKLFPQIQINWIVQFMHAQLLQKSSVYMFNTLNWCNLCTLQIVSFFTSHSCVWTIT